MIKFFRNIRQKLLSENKFSKYLLYAIGEIVLVVIGILIALQINNWNEYQKERKVEIEILKEIQNNLNQDIINLNTKIDETDNSSMANKKVLEHLKNKTPLSDSLKKSYALLGSFGTFRPITAGYENLKSKGVDIIQNKELRNAITKLYDFQYFYFVEDLIYAIDDFRSDKSSYVNDKVFWEENVRNYSAQPINLEALYNDDTFKGYLSSSIVLQNWMKIRRSAGIQQINEVIQLIENELKK
ncbi:hypothetical protein H7U19_15415 [Hyunsoonleella sp. SJ7]|uniref:Uncharacterized protein n=1 Tax=Hyunsoonleella aquatilis TaxID=2762758 RepID=A0A923KH64_9FLAO|nr:DUF6090 family protein [Hyunsoonleella aquatilis]MBC3759801.1 hypothetical protein [Hyunsoonleella aquatilis]